MQLVLQLHYRTLKRRSTGSAHRSSSAPHTGMPHCLFMPNYCVSLTQTLHTTGPFALQQPHRPQPRSSHTEIPTRRHNPGRNLRTTTTPHDVRFSRRIRHAQSLRAHLPPTSPHGRRPRSCPTPAHPSVAACCSRGSAAAHSGGTARGEVSIHVPSRTKTKKEMKMLHVDHT